VSARRYIDPFEPQQVRRLVAEFGSPLLIVDCARVRAQYRRLRRALPGVALHYALKPLPHAAVVESVLGLGGSLDLATTGEVQLARRLGVDPARCIHTHPIKRDRDIRNALDYGITSFVADNPDEVRKFRAYADRATLLLRVSFRSPGAVCDLSRKFGCDPEQALELARLAARVRAEFAHLVRVVGHERRDAVSQRVVDVALALDRMRMDATRRINAEAGGELHFTGCGQVQPAAGVGHRLHHGRMRQGLERVVQVHAGQRALQRAVLAAHTGAVDDQQWRAELGHQPPDLRRFKRIDESLAAHGSSPGSVAVPAAARVRRSRTASQRSSAGISWTSRQVAPILSSVRRLAYRSCA